MKVTIEIEDYSKPSQPCIRVHNSLFDDTKVELEVKGERFTVSADEIISAIRRATLGVIR